MKEEAVKSMSGVILEEQLDSRNERTGKNQNIESKEEKILMPKVTVIPSTKNPLTPDADRCKCKKEGSCLC